MTGVVEETGSYGERAEAAGRGRGRASNLLRGVDKGGLGGRGRGGISRYYQPGRAPAADSRTPAWKPGNSPASLQAGMPGVCTS